MLFRNRADDVRADGEEGIAEVWNQYSNLAGTLFAERASEFIALVAKLVDRSEDPVPQPIRYIRASIQDT